MLNNLEDITKKRKNLILKNREYYNLARISIDILTGLSNQNNPKNQNSKKRKLR